MSLFFTEMFHISDLLLLYHRSDWDSDYPCIGIKLSATAKSQPVAALTCSSEKSGLISVNVRPLVSSITNTPWKIEVDFWIRFH